MREAGYFNRMGCGAGKVAPEPEAPKELTQAEREAIAVRALKDALKMALGHALEQGSQAALWAEDKYRIKAPNQEATEGKISECQEAAKASKIPILPGAIIKICDQLTSQLEDVSKQFGDAAMTVVVHPGFKACYDRIIDELTTTKALELCRTGGTTACTDYLEAEAKAKIMTGVTLVVGTSLKEHTLPKNWKKFSETWNSLSDKVSKVSITLDKLEFDFDEYVAEKTLDHFREMMMEKEKEIRKAPGQAVSEAVKQVFGGADPSTWKKVG